MNEAKRTPKELTRRQVLAGAASVAAAFAVPSVAAASPRGMAPASSVVIDVISDVQGDLPDLGHAMRDLRSLERADAMVVNGDLVPNGTVAEYEAYYEVFDANPHPKQVLTTIGNHEQYTSDPFDVQVQRYLDYSGMPDVYYEKKVRGVTVLAIGTTAPRKSNGGLFVTLGEEQLRWLKRTLDRESRSGKPVLVFSHHVLPDSVSGSTGPDAATFYDQDFVEEDRLLGILGDHPNLIFFSGHSHWDLHRDDWAVRKVVPGGHPDGFTVVNASFIQTMYEPDGQGGEVGTGPAEMQGSRVTVDRRGTVKIEARDFLHDDSIKTLQVRTRR